MVYSDSEVVAGNSYSPLVVDRFVGYLVVVVVLVGIVVAGEDSNLRLPYSPGRSRRSVARRLLSFPPVG